MKTSKEIYDSYQDKNSFEWVNRDITQCVSINMEKRINISWIK